MPLTGHAGAPIPTREQLTSAENTTPLLKREEKGDTIAKTEESTPAEAVGEVAPPLPDSAAINGRTTHDSINHHLISQNKA